MASAASVPRAGQHHVNDPYRIAMTIDRNPESCNQCHSIGQTELVAGDGFINTTTATAICSRQEERDALRRLP